MEPQLDDLTWQIVQLLCHRTPYLYTYICQASKELLERRKELVQPPPPLPRYERCTEYRIIQKIGDYASCSLWIWTDGPKFMISYCYTEIIFPAAHGCLLMTLTYRNNKIWFSWRGRIVSFPSSVDPITEYYKLENGWLAEAMSNQ